MRVILNASRISANSTGLAKFSINSARYLCSKLDKNILVCQSSFPICGENARSEAPGIIGMGGRFSFLKPILWEIYFILYSLFNRGVVISFTHHAFPLQDNQIVVVHDLRPLFYPDNFVQYFNFKYILPRVLKRVRKVVCVSEATRRKVAAEYGIDFERISVIPNLVDVSAFNFQQSTNSSSIHERHWAPYILMVGASWQHKNLHEVLKVSSLWRGKYKLKVVAKNGPYVEYTKTLVKHYGIHEDVEYYSNVEQSDLDAMICGASALIYPSLDEGFGIPPLEALVKGVPVIVSDIDVFREVLESLPIYVKLGDYKSWGEAFAKLGSGYKVDEQLVRDVFEKYSYEKFSQAWDCVIDQCERFK